MSMFSKLVIVALLSVVGATPSVPTSNPSSAPTSAPTSATELTPTPAPTAADTPTPAPTAADTSSDAGSSTTAADSSSDAESSTTTTVNSTSDPEVSTTAAANSSNVTDGPQLAKTTFTAKVKLQAASDFDESKYLQALARASGANASNIKVISVAYDVTTQYSFADDVTAEDVESAVAKQLSVSEDKVTATVTSADARRLREGRRLAVTADVTVSLDDAAAADAALTDLNNTAALATEMNVAAPAVVSSGVTVNVRSEITSTTGRPVEAPLAADVASEMGSLIGKPVEVEIADVETTGTDGAIAVEQSGASSKFLATPAVLLAMAVSSLLF